MHAMQDTWEWTPVEMAEDVPQPSARSFAAMCALPGSQLLLFGGLEQPERRLDDTWLFDTTTCGAGPAAGTCICMPRLLHAGTCKLVNTVVHLPLLQLQQHTRCWRSCLHASACCCCLV